MPSAQNLVAEVYTGSWTAITSFIYQRDGLTIQRGRQNEASTIQPCTAGFTLNNRDGRFTTRNPVGAYYPSLVQNTPLRLSMPVADVGLTNYLRLETDQVSYASCPDSAGLQITSGTLSVRWDGQLTAWTGNPVLVAKSGATAQAWTLYVAAGGTPEFEHWDSGGLSRQAPAGQSLPYFNARIAVRVDYNISAQTITYYWAPTMAGAWTQLGPVMVTGATTLAAGTGQVVQAGNGGNVGGVSGPGMSGSVYEVQILSTATVKADPVFSSQTAGATSFTDAQSNTWTLTGTAEISSRLYRYHGEMSSVPKTSDPSATDVYSQAAAYGVTQRLQAANTPLNSPMYRSYVRLPSSLDLMAYWPGEDGTNATAIGAAVGTIPLNIYGSPTLASYTGFACSNPLPVMNGATFLGNVTTPPGFTWTDNVVRFLLAVPAADDTNGSLVCQILTTGTIQRLDLLYFTGGNLNLTGYNSAGTQVFTTGNLAFGLATLAQCRVSVELTSAGGSHYALWVVTETGSSSTGTSSTFTGSIGAVTTVQFGALQGFGGLDGSAMGHFSVQAVSDSVADLIGPLMAWEGETAGARVARLCAEEGIASRVVGPPGLSAAMGPQPIDTLYNILTQCETTDMGQLFEPRQALGIGYRTRNSLYHQTPAVTASFSSAQVYQGFGSTADTLLTINDVTAAAPDGSLARQFLAAGPMSVQSPPAGIGRLDTQIQPNPATDTQLVQIASWYLWVRSVNDDRYPAIPFQMNRSETPLTAAVADIGDCVQVTGAPAWLPPPPVTQIYAGVTETYYPGPAWQLAINGIPELPYETAQVATAHADTSGSALTSGITAGATSFQVTTTAGFLPWDTTAAASFPYDIVIDGEQMTVSAISSTSSPQTFTISARAVNGVSRAHSASAAVALYHTPVVSM